MGGPLLPIIASRLINDSEKDLCYADSISLFHPTGTTKVIKNDSQRSQIQQAVPQAPLRAL
jgi:hypothetical protein